MKHRREEREERGAEESRRAGEGAEERRGEKRRREEREERREKETQSEKRGWFRRRGFPRRSGEESRGEGRGGKGFVSLKFEEGTKGVEVVWERGVGTVFCFMGGRREGGGWYFGEF